MSDLPPNTDRLQQAIEQLEERIRTLEEPKPEQLAMLEAKVEKYQRHTDHLQHQNDRLGRELEVANDTIRTVANERDFLRQLVRRLTQGQVLFGASPEQSDGAA